MNSLLSSKEEFFVVKYYHTEADQLADLPYKTENQGILYTATFKRDSDSAEKEFSVALDLCKLVAGHPGISITSKEMAIEETPFKVNRIPVILVTNPAGGNPLVFQVSNDIYSWLD